MLKAEVGEEETFNAQRSTLNVQRETGNARYSGERITLGLWRGKADRGLEKDAEMLLADGAGHTPHC